MPTTSTSPILTVATKVGVPSTSTSTTSKATPVPLSPADIGRKTALNVLGLFNPFGLIGEN